MVRFLYLSSLWMFIVYHAVLRSYFHSFFNYWECKRFVHIFPCVLLFSHILRILEWDWDEWFIENSEGVSYCALDWLVKLKKSCRESGPECRMCPHEWEELVHSTVTGALKKKKKAGHGSHACSKYNVKTIYVILAFICFIVQKSLRAFGSDTWDHFNQPYRVALWDGLRCRRLRLISFPRIPLNTLTYM